MSQALQQKPMADSAKRMGRPPLGIITTTVRLPRAVLERIDALRGANRRAVFIREAVEEKLKREAPGA